MFKTFSFSLQGVFWLYPKIGPTCSLHVFKSHHANINLAPVTRFHSNMLLYEQQKINKILKGKQKESNVVLTIA